MKTYMADPVKFTLYLAAAIFLAAAAVMGTLYGAWLFAGIFGVASICFFWFAKDYAAVVTVTEEGLYAARLPGMKKKYVPFQSIQEVGALGSNPRGPGSGVKGNPGVIYIYFSEKKLDEDARRRMTFSIPAGIWFLRFTQERYDYVQSCWDQDIVCWNTGTKVI